MVCPEVCRLFCQATPDAILENPDHFFYLPTSIAVANGSVVVDDTQPLAELYKAAHKLSAIICPEVMWLAPMGNQIIIQELSSPLAV